MARWESYVEKNKSQNMEDLISFLRIPSISSLPEHAAAVKEAADWTAARMQRAGVEGVRVLPTGGHPVVYGEWLHATGKPTILIYGHFDVQPVDPLDLWTDPPFEPVVRNGRVYARGASDDKGNMLIPIIAAEALLHSEGALPVNVKFLFEGQEEIGSPQLPGFVASHADLLACDLILNSDGGQWEEDQPAILTGLRGMCGLQFDVKAAKQDVHSGVFGGTFLNPIHAIAQIIASMRGPDGTILVKGFYDAVRPLSDTEKEQIAAIPYDEETFKAALGVKDLFGEPGYSTYERVWTRPTLEINGIWGGFQGEGTKTVIPSEAHAKVTCRLVPDQAPDKILQLVTAHIERHTPPGVTVTVRPNPSKAEAYVIPFDHPGNKAALSVLKKVYGKDPYVTREGGSVPICSSFLKSLGSYSVSFAFGLKDESIHAPNEFFRITSFERGQTAYCLLLEELGRVLVKK